jgi:hypothetical protein
VSIYKTREFAKFAPKASLGEDDLIVAAEAVAPHRWDADLGGGVFKKRVGREGAGKSGGFRTLIVFKSGGHSFFVFRFAKNDRANITPKELKALKRLADTLLDLEATALSDTVSAGELMEVGTDGKGREQG